MMLVPLSVRAKISQRYLTLPPTTKAWLSVSAWTIYFTFALYFGFWVNDVRHEADRKNEDLRRGLFGAYAQNADLQRELNSTNDKLQVFSRENLSLREQVRQLQQTDNASEGKRLVLQQANDDLQNRLEMVQKESDRLRDELGKNRENLKSLQSETSRLQVAQDAKDEELKAKQREIGELEKNRRIDQNPNAQEPTGVGSSSKPRLARVYGKPFRLDIECAQAFESWKMTAAFGAFAASGQWCGSSREQADLNTARELALHICGHGCTVVFEITNGRTSRY